MDRALDWLLSSDQPAIRYLALTQLEGRSESDSDVRESRRRLGSEGWVAEMLAERSPRGTWGPDTALYRPKYVSANWRLLVLSDLGITRSDPRIRTSAGLWIKRFGKPDGGFGTDGASASHLCVTGNTARALARFGYADERPVRSAMKWLAEAADPKGGWSCFGRGRNLDSWEGLSAFAAYPRAEWTGPITKAVEEGAEFYLSRELHRQGGRYAPWFRTHYPVHYYYDLLVGLDVLTSLGYAGDPRMRFARDWLLRKRRADGRWLLDAVHPDVEGGVANWFAHHPSQRPTPWALEVPGRPSLMITLIARRILARFDRVVG